MTPLTALSYLKEKIINHLHVVEGERKKERIARKQINSHRIAGNRHLPTYLPSEMHPRGSSLVIHNVFFKIIKTGFEQCGFISKLLRGALNVIIRLGNELFFSIIKNVIISQTLHQ
jgi:hypothetical protein